MNPRVFFLIFASIALYAIADDRTTREIAIDIDTTLTTCCAEIAENFIGTFTVIASIVAPQQSGCKTQIIRQADVGTTGFTITTSGVYQVVENIVFNPTTSSAAITISADNVTLDLQCFSIVQANSTANVDGVSVSANVSSVSIESGKLANFTRDGIRIASGCSLISYTNITIQNCLYGIFLLGTDVSIITDIQATGLDLLSNSTGLSLNFVERAIVSMCNFFGNTHAGIELISSFSNTIESCSIENTNAVSGSAFAISLSNGENNRINSCYIDGVSTADTFSGNSAVGILIGATENNDIITNNQIKNCTTSSNAQPFGIEMLYTLTESPLIVENNNIIFATGSWSPNGQYFANIGLDASEVSFYEIQENNIVQLSSVVYSGTAGLPGWSPDGSFMALGDSILQINQGLPITVVVGSGGASLSSLWSPNGKYIAIGSDAPDVAVTGIYKFDGTQVIKVLGQQNLGYISWSPDSTYLASCSIVGLCNVYKFVNDTHLQVVATIPSGTIQTCNWSNDGRYIVITDSSGSASIHKFDGSSLTQVASVSYSGTPVNAVWSPDNQYIAVSIILTDGIVNNLEIYKFTGDALTPVSDHVSSFASANSGLSWSALGNFIAYSQQGFTLAIFAGQQFPTGNLIQNNEISNVQGPALLNGQPGASSGRGLSASSATNLILQNIAFDNDINYVFVNNIFEQFISNAVPRPSLLSNISFPPL